MMTVLPKSCKSHTRKLPKDGTNTWRSESQRVVFAAAVDAEMHGDYVSGMDIARERLQVIDDLFLFLLRNHAVVIAGDVQRQLVFLEEPFFGGVVFAARRPVEPSRSVLLDAY